MEHQESQHWYNGTEHSLIGLSPQYWCYTPMLICDVNRLALINGLDCILCHVLVKKKFKTMWSVPYAELNNRNVDTKKNHESPLYRVLPVSRCELCGVIVNLEHRSNGGIHLLLDDGTGIVDCMSWETDAPELLPMTEPIFSQKRPGFRLGDMVRVLGKIKCVELTLSTNDIQILSRAASGEERYENVQYRGCVREIHVVLMENINSEGRHSVGKHISPTPTDYETLHWLKSFHLMERLNSVSVNNGRESLNMGLQYDGKDDDYQNILLSKKKRVPNGADVLLDHLKMGKYLRNEDLDSCGMNSDSRSPAVGENCCCDQSYKNYLLYCHCGATKEQLDPKFRFRDALLNRLLDMEGQILMRPDYHAKKEFISTKPLHLLSPQTNMVDFILDSPSLKFNYADILGDKKLALISENIVKLTSNPIINQKRLYTRTLVALRQDGIIFHIDEDLDKYLLISFHRVLEPIVKKVLLAKNSQRNYKKTDLPFFLKNVPKSRLDAAEGIIYRNEKHC